MADSRPDGVPELAGQSETDRLESWKEIAAYLGRGVTTVQRWEQDEGLPVHRLPHAKKGSVFAFKRELDRWRIGQAEAAAMAKAVEATSPTDGNGTAVPRSVAADGRRIRPWWLAGGLAAGALVAFGLMFRDEVVTQSPTGAGMVAAPLIPRPVANDGASESWPSLSPAGDRVVYLWEREGAPGLHVKPLPTGPAVPLRFDDPSQFGRAAFTTWSPRGDLIAFLINEEGADQDTRGLYVIPPSGGSPRRLMSIYGTGLCWTPDGRTLAFTDRTSTGEPLSIFATSLERGGRERLTAPPAGTFGDTRCAFSPDGRRLAVSRYASRYQSDLYVLAFPGGSLEGTRLTRGLSGIQGIDWTPDGASLVFGSHNGLWLVASSAEAPQEPALIAAAGISAAQPTFSRRVGQPNRLVYQHGVRDVNIWRWQASADSRMTPTTVAASTVWDDHPALSPDGRRIAFASNRTGANEIWAADAGGSNPQQLTFHNGPVVIAPRWSPDGTHIAFSSQVGANRDIYVVHADGSEARRVTWEPSHEDNPSWSRDGRWIYFRSDRGGISQIWKISPGGGAPVRVTTGAASQGLESADGRLYFVRSMDVPGLWSTPAGGGDETFVMPDVREGFWGASDRGIAFLVSDPKQSPGGPTVRFFEFASGHISTLVTLPVKPDKVSPGFAVAHDARTVLWTQTDVSQSDVMLIEPWPSSRF